MPKMETRKCKICGTEFETSHYSKICCSKECAKENYKIISREHQRRITEMNRLEREKNKKQPKKKTMSVTDIAVKAKAAGMSYGQYVATMNMS